jgi:hypothetical protein
VLPRPLRLGLLLALALALACGCGHPGLDARGESAIGAGEGVARALPAARERLLAGVGDRLVLHGAGPRVDLYAEARRLGLPTDLFQVWLPRGWHESWVPRAGLEAIQDRGGVPVVVHYFFGSGISRERVEAGRAEWQRDLARLARSVDLPRPVLVVLEPEFNDAPPAGETPITRWAGFGAELRAAAAIVRRGAPGALVGTCAGDFSPDRNLEPLLGRVAPELDFLGFQEMRAAGAPDAGRPGYDEVGRAAVDYAGYLQQAFGRPILLCYVAVSSWRGWAGTQARALGGLVERREELRRRGVFGLVYFQLRDDPLHRGYFGAAERHFGLLDAAGAPKPALSILRRLARSPRG